MLIQLIALMQWAVVSAIVLSFGLWQIRRGDDRVVARLVWFLTASSLLAYSYRLAQLALEG